MNAPTTTRDLLAGARWQCTSTSPGAVERPEDLDDAADAWRDARVPGTVAAALRESGEWRWEMDDEELLDGRDWWYRCRFRAEGEGPWALTLGGLATIADVWLNGERILHSENMFTRHMLAVPALRGDDELAIRFAALQPLLERRRPRPRWPTRLTRSQNLRWYRTTPLGRIPGWFRSGAPVGPWRQVLLQSTGSARLAGHRLTSVCDGEAGVVRLEATIVWPGAPPAGATLTVGETSAPLAIEAGADGLIVSGTVSLPEVQRWWPHTHGTPTRYPAALDVDEWRVDLGSVGFRTVSLNQADGDFALSLNEQPLFCRGACWLGPDVVSFNPPAEDVRSSLLCLREAGMNMVRLGGYTVYEDGAFWDACDELGILVWQDCMLASFDPPEDAEFHQEIAREITQALGELSGRPSLAVVCGSSEAYQQAAMYGLEAQRRTSTVLEDTIPRAVAAAVPGIPYVASAPIGGDPPFRPEQGVSHYFGVGAYMRPPADARLSSVRFAAECLAFAIPPEAEAVEAHFGGSLVAGHEPSWKAGVARDSRISWDFEDVRDHYVREMYGVDPFLVRYADPDLALDLGRAVAAELMAGAMAEWRRERSPCRGALVLAWRDRVPGAGWGLLDSDGRPKAPWYALRRVLAPVTVVLTDEGLSGLAVHVFNDGGAALTARLQLRVFAPSGVRVEFAERALELPARRSLELSAEELLGGFRDLNRAYRFGPASYDVVVATLIAGDDEAIGEAVHLPLGWGRHREPDVGLRAEASHAQQTGWSLTVSTAQFAQSVAIDVPGYRPSDSWFHLPPGDSRRVRLEPAPGAEAPSGRVRALNSTAAARVTVA